MENRKLKIAFLNIYQNSVNRGAETFVGELSRRLEREYEVDVLSGKRVPTPKWPILWRLFVDPQGLSVLFFTLKLVPKILKEKYDIIFPLNGGWQSLIIRIITWIYGGKMIVSGQSGKGWDDRINLWSFPDIFVSLSSFLKVWAKKVNPFVKVEYIPNGVDIHKFSSEGKSLSIPLEKPIILCAGALTPEKRIDLTIKAVTKMEKAGLLVVGQGRLRSEIEKMGKNMLGKRFMVTSVPYKNMPEVYRAADLFSLTSPWYRSFEIVLVEAMATNIPVVANNDPIRKEIVGDGGLLVDPGNIDEYAEALKRSLETRWGNKPREQAKKFDWDIIADKYEKLIGSLLK